MANDEKMNKFYQAINHYAEEQRKKIETEITDFKRKELDDAEVDALTEAYNMIQKEMAEMRNGISRELARRELMGRRELLEQRGKITEEVFERAAKELAVFAQTEQYADMLVRFAAQLPAKFRGAGTVIYLKKEDEKFEDQIKNAFGGSCTFQADAEIKIGGIRACNSEMGIMADETLDSLLEDQRAWFEENSGMAVV